MAKTNNSAKLRLSSRTYLGCFLVTTIIMLSSYTWLGPEYSLKENLGIGVFTLLATTLIGMWVVHVTTKQIENVINTLSVTSGAIMSSVASMSEASHKLAQGASEQTASVHETSATMEETSSLVQQNTQNTKEAVALADNAKNDAKSGVQSVDKLLGSMKELEKSSEEVQKIIKVIDDMAFQTNILSLNAAVEAARAGDAGKGFAVVAEEVRNLAQRSAQAAKETAVLIDSNVGLTKTSVRVSEQVGRDLKDIDLSVTKVKELLDEISTASQEQVIAASQIAQALTQIDQVVENQSAIAQSSASGADALEEYCAHLKGVMIQLISILKDPAKYNISTNNESTYTIKTNKKITSGPSERRSMESGNLSGAVAINPESVIPLDDF